MNGRLAVLAAAALGVGATGCSPAAINALSAGLTAATAAAPAPSRELFLFGGDGHKTFLACLNCSQYASGSVLNSYGSYGSAYSSTSIFNAYSQFGSPYSTFSACNKYASDPPVLVDKAGKFYGRLTLNQYRSDAIKAPGVVAWLAAVCEH
jgi:hypothetical protein